MIDFRYHLVSLISVFLALAVGIVLGAGPLREPIRETLVDRIEQLRQEKDSLRADLATKTESVDHRDEYITAATPALVSGQLAGQTVALVRLPGVDDAAVDALPDTLETAGATLTARVEITGAWVDPERRTVRDQLATQLAASVPGGVDATGTDARLGALLARAIASGAPAGPAPVDAAARTVLQGLEGGDLVTVEGEVANLADVVLVLAPGLPDVGGAQATQPTPAADAVKPYVSITAALDAAAGAVVTGPASSAIGGGMVAAVRSDDAANRTVSTVDTGGTPMGAVASVLALREQAGGRSGSYGFGDGATAPLPDPAGSETTP